LHLLWFAASQASREWLYHREVLERRRLARAYGSRVERLLLDSPPLSAEVLRVPLVAELVRLHRH